MVKRTNYARTHEGERKDEKNTEQTVGCCRVDFPEFTSNQISTAENGKDKQDVDG
jgi:hypothetical protein